jgi:hypothetical protein
VKLVNIIIICVCTSHRDLSNIDCLKACTACLVCFISTVNGHSKKRLKCGASNGHIINLKQSIFSFNIYGTSLGTLEIVTNQYFCCCSAHGPRVSTTHRHLSHYTYLVKLKIETIQSIFLLLFCPKNQGKYSSYTSMPL